jgi:hypothetical protein
MTEALIQAGMPKRVLEVGTGSGYQAAVLATLGIEVYTVERIGELLRTARKRFRTLGLNVRSKHDDGRIGWPECAPFDAIVVTAAAPALALSLVSSDHKGRHYETAARAAVEIIARLKIDPLPADTILNVNVPDMAWDDVRGFEVARLGNRHRAEPCVQQEDPRGRTWWWIGAAGAAHDAGPGTDFHAVHTGHISITPIHVDLTRYQALEQVASWVGGLEASLREDAA